MLLFQENNINFYNQGNVESYPLIKITGNGNIVGALNGYNISIDDVLDYVYIDMKTMKVYRGANENYYPNYKGVPFVSLIPMSNNILSITSGTVTQVDITLRSKRI